MQTTLSRNCRLCGRALPPQVLLHYRNMPAAAQHLPGPEDLAQDHGIDLAIKQGPACGLVQLDADPVPYYREVIRASGVSGELKDFYTRRLWAFAQRHALGNRPVLEAGCGEGTYLECINRAGMRGFGIEAGANNLRQCADRGLNVTEGFFDRQLSLTDAPFAAFFMFNFLEHIPDPRGYLLHLADQLADDAVGLVEVPSFSMMQRQALYTEFIADHLCYYTPETLGRLVELSGFTLVECEHVRDDYVLAATLRKRPRLVLDDSNVQRNAAALDSFIAAHGNLAVWGAGHQAFTLLALCRNHASVNCIIDSAPFKQGRFAPVTHIPIVSPSCIGARGIQNILVIAGSYSQEIATLINRQYPEIQAFLLSDDGSIRA